MVQKVHNSKFGRGCGKHLIPVVDVPPTLEYVWLTAGVAQHPVEGLTLVPRERHPSMESANAAYIEVNGLVLFQRLKQGSVTRATNVNETRR